LNHLVHTKNAWFYTKVKVSLYYVMQVYREGRGIAISIFTPGVRRGAMINKMPLPLYHSERTPVPIVNSPDKKGKRKMFVETHTPNQVNFNFLHIMCRMLQCLPKPWMWILFNEGGSLCNANFLKQVVRVPQGLHF
jgi:hypothetical protein